MSEQAKVIKTSQKSQRYTHAESALKGPTFTNILCDNLEVVVCTDAALATNYDKSWPLGIIVSSRGKTK